MDKKGFVDNVGTYRLKVFDTPERMAFYEDRKAVSCPKRDGALKPLKIREANNHSKTSSTLEMVLP